MIGVLFPLKKLRRNGKHLLLAAIVLIGAVAVYHEMVATKAWGSSIGMIPNNSRMRALFFQRGRSQAKDSAGWTSSFTPQLWKPEFKGLANLHVFEDWCGSSTDGLRRNLHYPLHPHTRTTVSKLAVSPKWTNYGLRLFGYLHPYADGEFVFALGSADNSELWLSADDSPLNLQLLAWVGKTGSEWTAPGEFDKYASQTSRPVRLFAQRRYFFEVIYKQNDRGSDHVEVAWQLLDKDFRLKIIESKHISLYTDDSGLLLSDVAHIPQTAASHQQTAAEQPSAAAEMLRADPRDTFHEVPMVNSKFLEGVLPDCSYRPSYTIKNFRLRRYEGLKFIHLSYVYPNDYTRLTHMETERSCFYTDSPYGIKTFDFSHYMLPDYAGSEERNAGDFGSLGKKSVLNRADSEPRDEHNGGVKKISRDHIVNAIIPDYGDDFDDYNQKRRRKLFSLDIQESADKAKAEGSFQQNQPAKKQDGQDPKTNETKLLQKMTTSKSARKLESKSPGKAPPPSLVDDPLAKDKQRPAEPLERLRSTSGPNQILKKMNRTQMQRPNVSQLNTSERAAPLPDKPTVAKKRLLVTKDKDFHPANVENDFNLHLEGQPQENAESKNSLKYKEIELNMPLQNDANGSIRTARPRMNSSWSNKEAEVGRGEEVDTFYDDGEPGKEKERSGEEDTSWGQGWNFEDADYEEPVPKTQLDQLVIWNQTFGINNFNRQALRSDWLDLNCNISGNLLLHASDAVPIVNSFMQQLNRKHDGRFTLLRVINVVKRADGSHGSRYFLELELQDSTGQVLRLSRYIYALIRQRPKRSRRAAVQPVTSQIVLCNPVGFQWNPTATVHFIVPVKNQARWVQQLIVDMEGLFRKTGDTNFNLIITDYNSTDMDVRKALEKSTLPRYQYVKLRGNFQRSAGLQAGIDLVDDDHSIIFLCDLHIHFPPSIIDTIRKHSVEGYMAFAPVVFRLNCGATPSEARGYWEVNGFGLLGIYKSDLVAAGGMNTREFTDRWGGEDWELLDRILQAGLEVERIFLRNYFHHFHSKRGMWNRRTSKTRM